MRLLNGEVSLLEEFRREEGVWVTSFKGRLDFREAGIQLYRRKGTKKEGLKGSHFWENPKENCFLGWGKGPFRTRVLNLARGYTGPKGKELWAFFPFGGKFWEKLGFEIFSN